MPRTPPFVAATAALLLLGCGSWGRVGSQPSVQQGETLT